MKRQVLFIAFIALLASTFLTACHQEELTPRTNPRFSETSVQKIDETGVEFACNIYDFGSEEIIEYGFLYSLNDYPIMENSEIISQVGKPENQFSLKVEQSLIKGANYAVVAFIQTSTERVYSKPIGFVSQGAPGFVFEKLVYKSPIYYGDTITVLGSNLSPLEDRYAVKFQTQAAEILDIDEYSFKFIVPEFFEFNTSGNGLDYFDIILQVLDKTIPLNVEIPFQDPVFQDQPTQYIDLGKSVEILGNYLNDANMKIITSDNIPERIYSSNVTIDYVGNEKIVFRPKPYPSESNKHLTLEIRGKLYSLGTNVFEFTTPAP